MKIEILDKCIFGNRISLYVKLLLWVLIALIVGRILSVIIKLITLYLYDIDLPDGLVGLGGSFYFIGVVIFITEELS